MNSKLFNGYLILGGLIIGAVYGWFCDSLYYLGKAEAYGDIADRLDEVVKNANIDSKTDTE